MTVHRGEDTPEEIRQKHIDHHMNYCVHYNGRNFATKQSTCMAGETHGDKKVMGCCIGGHLLENHPCPKWERQSLESAIERHERIEESFRQMELVGPVVAEWRKKPWGKSETIECPACKGRLHLSQSAYNGHVHGECETEGCVSWME